MKLRRVLDEHFETPVFARIAMCCSAAVQNAMSEDTFCCTSYSWATKFPHVVLYNQRAEGRRVAFTETRRSRNVESSRFSLRRLGVDFVVVEI